MGRNVWYPGFVSVVQAVCCWCSLFWLFTLVESGEVHGIFVGPFLVFACLCFGFFALFLRRPRSVPALAAAGGILWAAGSVVLLWKCSDLVTLSSYGFGLLAVLTVVLLAIRGCMEPISAVKSISALECIAIFLLFFVWVQTLNGISFTYSLPLLGASLLSASVVIYQRIGTVGGSGRGLRGVVIVAIMLVVIALLMVLFVAYGAEPAGQGLLLLYYSVVYCLKLLLRVMEAIMMWLASLLPESGGSMEVDALPEMTMPEGAVEEMNLPPWVLLVLGTVGLCAAAAIVVWILFRLRKLRVGGSARAYVQSVTERKKVPFGRWLRRVWKALKQKLFLLWAVTAMRGSPQELYLYLKRGGRRLGCRQNPGETPCAYVRRMAVIAADWAEENLPRALEELAEALGACLYAPEPPAPLQRETVRCIRRGYRKALGKARRAQLRRWATQASRRRVIEMH